MTDLAIVTVAAPAFRPRARVLTRSLKRFHPTIPILALAVEADAGDPARLAGTTLVDLGDLRIPDLPGFLFRYPYRELAIAAKPFLLGHALDLGFSSVLYLDADVWVVAELGALLRRVRAHPLTLSPHRLTPAANSEDELRLLRAGTFNGGVLGVSGSEARPFLEWWGARVHADCRMAPEAGVHHDQRWLDLAPGFLERMAIESDPGVNVAYWNLDERPISRRDGSWFAGAAPLRLFHFSGFSIEHPSRSSVHSIESLPPAAERLFAEYAQGLLAEGEPDSRCAGVDSEYVASRFDNGVVIPAIARTLYSEAPTGLGDPTRSGSGSFYDWLLAPQAGDAECRLPRLWREIHRLRPDVARAFPDPRGRDHEGFVAWAHQYGCGEYGLDAAFLHGLDARPPSPVS